MLACTRGVVVGKNSWMLLFRFLELKLREMYLILLSEVEKGLCLVGVSKQFVVRKLREINRPLN